MSPSPSSARRALVALTSLSLALAAGCLFLGLRLRAASSRELAPSLLRDESVRSEAVRALVDAAGGIFDNHPDPDVSFVLQPNLRRHEATGTFVSSNARGMRELEFEMPKPAGLVRVVFLGDSFVQGYGVEGKDRMGVFLQEMLEDRRIVPPGELQEMLASKATPVERIECLHIAVGGWTVRNETAYLRRILTDLQPDLVVHLLISNDLDDAFAVRGFGGFAEHTPWRVEGGDTKVYLTFPETLGSPDPGNYLLSGIDWESQHRYAEMAEDIAQIDRIVHEHGGRYLAVSHWGGFNWMIRRELEDDIDPSRLVYLPYSMFEGEMRLSPTDSHWSRSGHESFARIVFTLIRERDLLPMIALEPWEEVEAEGRAALAKAVTEMEKMARSHGSMERYSKAHEDKVVARLTFPPEDPMTLRQVYAGLDKEWRGAPFASFVLARKEGREVEIAGRALDPETLRGSRLRLVVDDVDAGEIELEPGEAFRARFPLVGPASQARFVNVRLFASDHLLVGPDSQHCVSYYLDELAIVP